MDIFRSIGTGKQRLEPQPQLGVHRNFPYIYLGVIKVWVTNIFGEWTKNILEHFQFQNFQFSKFQNSEYALS
jgi:hypothetical protein